MELQPVEGPTMEQGMSDEDGVAKRGCYGRNSHPHLPEFLRKNEAELGKKGMGWEEGVGLFFLFVSYCPIVNENINFPQVESILPVTVTG